MHVRRALALTAALPLLLVGCSAAEEPSSKDPETSPSATSSSPSVTASSPTAEPTAQPTREPEKVGPKEFIEQWAYVEREMQETGDTAEYLQLSRGCRECAAVAALVERRYAAGGLVAWSGWRIHGIEPLAPGGMTFLVRVRSAPFMYKESAEDRITTRPEGPEVYRITVERARSSWVVTGRTEVPRRRPAPSPSSPGSAPV